MHYWVVVVTGVRTMSIQDEAAEFMRAMDGPPSHPRCAECGVPMWLVTVDHIGTIERKSFECKACDAKLVTHENNQEGV
jgi:hypothetical protein